MSPEVAVVAAQGQVLAHLLLVLRLGRRARLRAHGLLQPRTKPHLHAANVQAQVQVQVRSQVLGAHHARRTHAPTPQPHRARSRSK